jgi:hypothetical protein
MLVVAPTAARGRPTAEILKDIPVVILDIHALPGGLGIPLNPFQPDGRS